MSLEEKATARSVAEIASENAENESAALSLLRRHWRGETGTRWLLVLSAPTTGASDVLHEFYETLFREQSETIPIYFSIKPGDKTVKNCAVRFLHSFLAQAAAFRRQDKKLLDISPQSTEVAGLADTDKEIWIRHLAENYEQGINSPDEQTFVHNCLNAPLRAGDTRFFVIIDNLQNAEFLTGETDLIETLKGIYSGSDIQIVFAGRRRFVLKAMRTSDGSANFEVLHLDLPSPAEAEKYIENLAEKYKVRINEQTRDLIVRQLDAGYVFIESIIAAAHRHKIDLDSFQQVQQIYVDELFGGSLSKFYDAIFQRNAPDYATQKSLISLLYELTTNTIEEKADITLWREKFALSNAEFYRMMNLFHADEIFNLNSGMIEPERGNTVLSDYVKTRHQLEISTEPRAQVVGSFLAESLKRAPQLMSRFYRRAAVLDLRQLLSAFNCQKLPESLIDYTKFKEKYKGASGEEIEKNLGGETETINLPQTVFTTFGAAFYPAIKQIADEERCAVGIGFKAADYLEENEVAWIVAEIESKLEAAPDLAEFWCDRLEMLAVACNFKNYKLWLIAPEGFAADAMEILNQRSAYGSSRKQIELLAKFLRAETIIKQKRQVFDEYEIVVPMGDDTELIAAHAVEEIARRHHFQPRAITQIKTALVEACINATEHSLSPDRKIYQKFAVEGDKLVITISNRGVKIPSAKTAEMSAPIESDESRRGWGLKLMRTLMDEVKFEQTDDGTRILMVKYLK